MLGELLELEKRILQNKSELENLSRIYAQRETDAATGMQIQRLRLEVETMERQVSELKMRIAQPQMQQGYAPRQQVSPQALQMQQSYVAPQWNGQVYTAPKSNMEQTIGKTIMAVCASALIFISLIFFAAIVLPYLSTGAKVALMYGVSIVITVVGAVFAFIKKENKWYLSLTACGLGAIYISMMVSAIYFQLFGQGMLYTGILLWAVLVCVLSRLRSQVFLVIGQVGINIAAIFGACLAGATEEEGKMAFLVCYVVFAELIFFVSHIYKEYNKNLVNFIGAAFAAFVLMIGVNLEVMQGAFAVDAASLLLVGILLLLNILSITIWKIDAKNDVPFGIINAVYTVLAYVVLLRHWEAGKVVAIMFLSALLVLLEVKIKEWKPIGKIIYQCALILLLVCAVGSVEILRVYLSVAVPALVFLVYGFWRENPVYKIAGVVCATLFLLIPMNCYLRLVLGIGLVACTVLLLFRFRAQYRPWMKVLLYLWTILFVSVVSIWMFVEWGIDAEEARKTMVFALLTILQIVASKIKIWHRDPRTGEREESMAITLGVVHLILMFKSLEILCGAEDPMTRIVTIVFGALLLVADNKEFFRKDTKGYATIYQAVKVLLFVGAICTSFEMPGFVSSIVGIVVALGCVVYGFWYEVQKGVERKSCRIFGLVLVLISLVKLMLIDVHYENMGLRALSFFVSGVLCFGISFAYNVVDKWMNRK